MKVILIPQGGVENPYISLLVNSLRQASLDVNLAQSRRFILWRAIRDFGWPDVLHIQWLHPHFLAQNYRKAIMRAFVFYSQVFVLRLLGVRFVWTVHNIVNHEKEQMRWDLFNRKLMARLVHRLIVHCPTAVKLVSETYKIAPSKIGIAPMGNYIGYYPSAENRAQARQALNLPEDTLIYLFIGQIRPYKGINNLLDAFEKNDNKNACLVIAGQVKQQKLKQQLLDRIKLSSNVHAHLEFIADNTIDVFLQAADIIVLPYTDILTSSTVLLAMSYSRPVIVPKIGCVQELPADVALQYDSKQADGLQMALQLAETAPLKTMGKAAKKYAEKFPWSLTAQKLLDVYDPSIYNTTLNESEKEMTQVNSTVTNPIQEMNNDNFA